MATDGVVITEANDATPNIGTIFAGKSFLVTQRVPMRSNFLDRIRANGGRVVRLESQADFIIADHVRNDCPPKSLSYTFIEAAISQGALPDPNHHRAGPAPGFSRAVGGTAAAAPKATRTAFTIQDDRDLWTWVHHYKSLGAHAVKGNEIYKQLEQVNPRHTYQSWRDRYVKRLINNPPDGVDVGALAVQAGASQAQQPAVDGTNEAEVLGQDDVEEEQDADVLFLLENIDDILNIPAEDLDTVWASLADEESSSHLSADQWKRLYEEKALPAYEAKQKKEKRAKIASPVKRSARMYTPEPPEQNAEPTTPELVAMRAKAARERQASPSVSHKRKRQTTTPRGNTNGRKRTKGDDREVSAEEATAGGELTAQDEDSGTPNELALPGEEVLPTSELNRAAKAQLIAEADPELPSQQPKANGQNGLTPQGGLQLTAENLAHQEAANGEKTTRASDLQGTGDNLSEFAEYLQSNVKGPGAKAPVQQDVEEGREHDVPVAHDNGEGIANGATEAAGHINDDVQIDLTLAEPEGGFDFSSQEDSQLRGIPAQNAWEPTQDVEMEEAPARALAPADHAALDTQAIYAEGQQQPDFSFPSPPLPAVEDDGEDELPTDPLTKPAPVQDATPKATTTPRKPAQIPTHKQPEPADEPEGESIESFLARLTAKGYSPALLQSALFRTSAQLQATEVVAMYEKLGLPVPDIPEVWSEEDDAKVGTTDAKVFKALCEKKGWEEYDLRLNFLQEWRASQ